MSLTTRPVTIWAADESAFDDFSAEYDEQNRNQDFVTFTGSLEFGLFARVRGALTYEHDQGFDERDRADRVRLQLRAAW